MNDTTIMPSIVQIDNENLKQLVTEVRETVARDIQVHRTIRKPLQFGIVDLWKCRAMMRTAASMRKH